MLWYEAPVGVDSRDLFTRLNVGRIPLTDAELVKAQAAVKDAKRVKAAVQEASEVFLSPIVLGELRSGFLKGGRQSANERQLTTFKIRLDAAPRAGLLTFRAAPCRLALPGCNPAPHTTSSFLRSLGGSQIV